MLKALFDKHLTHNFKNTYLKSLQSSKLNQCKSNSFRGTMANGIAYQLSEKESEDEYNNHIQKILKINRDNLKSLTYPGSKAVFNYPPNQPQPQKDQGTVFFFDIDNCLYKRSTRIHDLMQVYIQNYFVRRLNVTEEEAWRLREKYYRTYGLAIQGLVKFHKIDALEYNEKVDDALPLQDILEPDHELRDMLIRLKQSGKIDKMWLFTNAYKNHAERVVSLLGIGDLFDGLTYCDYTEETLVCKPMEEAFHRAIKHAGVKDFNNCYFVDDSDSNIKTSMKLGFRKSVHFVEREDDLGSTPQSALLIRDILELPEVLPELFK